jgi:hypothetical protein
MSPNAAIVVTAACRIAATHHWPNATAPVAYLRFPHRHEFHVRVWKRVTHADRDVEIIQLKERVEATLAGLATNGDFGFMSCEMIASAIIELCGVDRCEVLEDGENGAEVSRCE